MLMFSKIPLNYRNIQEIIDLKSRLHICIGSHITLSSFICLLIFKSLDCLILVFYIKSPTVAPPCNVKPWSKKYKIILYRNNLICQIELQHWWESHLKIESLINLKCILLCDLNVLFLNNFLSCTPSFFFFFKLKNKNLKNIHIN